MRKILTLALLAIATLSSCSTDKDDEIFEPTKPDTPAENFESLYAQGWEQRDGQNARLKISFNSIEADMTRSSGTSMERNVEDVNLFLYNESLESPQHIFLRDNSSVTLPIVPGQWSIYAVANIGDDMGSMTQTEVEAYRYQITTEADLTFNSALVMTSVTEAHISGTQAIEILFRRAVARVDMRVTLAGEALSKLTLKRMRIVNAPKSSVLFAEASSAPATSELISYGYNSCGNGSTFSIYLLENLSGSMSHITQEEDKTMSNAPQSATYIEIEAETATSWVTYRIYLGENNTSDFNIRRNTVYDMDITIHNVDANDFRTTIRPFPVDVSMWVTSGSSSVVFYKEATSWTIEELKATVNLSIALNKAVIYDIDVEFEVQADQGDMFGGMGAVMGYFNKSLTIRIPAGATSGSISVVNTQVGYYMFAATHVKLTGVTKLSSLDENNYYPSTTLFKCEYSQRYENYYIMKDL